jgi:hypothetical protein
MLIVLNSSGSAFHYFAIEDSNYKKPLIRVLLGFFIVPIGVFIFLLIFSMLSGFLLPVLSIDRFSEKCKNVLFKVFLGCNVFLFIFSIMEFFSFFHNIYKFIVISSYTEAFDFECEVIQKEAFPSMLSTVEMDK